MTQTAPNTFLWDNICRLLGDPTLSIGKVERALGLSHTTTQRIREGETATRLSTLVQIATKLHIEVWQLLVPGLDPNDLPRLAKPGAEPAWPFDFEASRYEALLPKEQGMVDHAARLELERIEAKRRPLHSETRAA